MCLRLVLLTAVLSATGCSKKKEEPHTATPAPAAAAPRKALTVGLVTDVGGRGDQSFNDSALRGLELWAAGKKRAGTGYQPAAPELAASIPADLKEVGIAPVEVAPLVLQSKAQEDYEPNLQLLIDQGAKLAIGVGFMLENAVETVARRNPEAKFLLIDSPLLDAKGQPFTLPNVRTVVFREEEGSFLVGALAGLATKSQKVGFVGGMEIPLIKKFESGFKAGLAAVNPKAQLFAGYTGSFDNVTAGKQVGQDFLNKGADVVFHAAGSDGLGAIQAVKEARAQNKVVFAVGVDSNQSHLAPEAMLTSMVKRVDLAVYETVRDLAAGKFTSGDQALGLKEKGVALAPVQVEFEGKAAALERVDGLRQQVVAGGIKVPANAAELATFKAAPLISLRGISKRFGAVAALDDVSLELRAGEVLALVGENGAGKSSLMNVLYGLYQPDEGQVLMDGKPLKLKTPKAAIAAGIGMVHQHFMLVPTLTVAENVVLGDEPTSRGLFDAATAQREVAAACARFGFEVNATARIEELSVGSQQKVEIVKALYRRARILVLDEPTAVLTPQESAELFRAVRKLAAEGLAVVFIGHKLAEVLAVADRVAVLRRGRKVAEVLAAQTTAEALAEQMVGTPTAPPARAQLPVGEELCALTAASTASGVRLRGVNLRVCANEIVGIAGVDGNGQRELAEVLTGLRPLSKGRLTLLGEDVTGLKPGPLRARGVAHVPEDRLRRAVVPAMTVEENASLGRQHLPGYAKGPWVDFAGRRAHAKALLQEYDVRPPAPNLQLSLLSGGNQQKVVVGRELSTDPKLVVAVQPTRGLDLAAAAAVQRRLLDAKARGAGVVLVSLDLEELLAVCDRLYVLAGGRIAGELRTADANPLELGRLMLGSGH